MVRRSLRKEAGNPQLHSCHKCASVYSQQCKGTPSPFLGGRGRDGLEYARPSSACHPLKLSVSAKEVRWELCPGTWRQEASRDCHFRVPAVDPTTGLLELMSTELVTPSNHLMFPPSIFPGIRVFSSEAALPIGRPKYWSFTFSISPSNEYSGLTLDVGLVLGLILRPLRVLTCTRKNSFASQTFLKDICHYQWLSFESLWSGLLSVKSRIKQLLLCFLSTRTQVFNTGAPFGSVSTLEPSCSCLTIITFPLVTQRCFGWEG